MDTSLQLKKARKLMLILLFLGWALGNLDRYLINYAIVYIGDDLALTSTQTGVILSSFFLGYAIMQMPGGLLADKFGAKKVLLCAVVLWSIFTGLTAIAWSLTAMVIIRFLFGVGEAGFQPSASKIIATTFPKNERSKAMSVMLSSGAIMGMLVPIISAVLLVTIGWRLFFVIAGSLGVIIAILYWKFIKIPAPEKSPSDEATEKTPKADKGILKQLIKMPVMWSILAAFFTIYAVNWGLNSWMPTYLTDVRGLDILSIGWMQLIPGVIMVVAMLAFGNLIDKVSLKTSKIIGAVFAFLLAIIIFLMFNSSSMFMFIIYQCVMSVLATYIIILLPSFVLKIVPEQIAGTAVGMANTGGQLAGFVTPMLIGFMIDAFDGSYNAAIWMLVIFAGLCVISILTIVTKKKPEEVVVYETV